MSGDRRWLKTAGSQRAYSLGSFATEQTDGSRYSKMPLPTVGVRSPHISGGRRWLSCRQPACLYARQLRHGTDRRTDRAIPKCRPLLWGSAARTSLVAGGGKVAGSQRAYMLGSCATGQTDGRIALFQNADPPYGGGIKTCSGWWFGR